MRLMGRTQEKWQSQSTNGTLNLYVRLSRLSSPCINYCLLVAVGVDPIPIDIFIVHVLYAYCCPHQISPVLKQTERKNKKMLHSRNLVPKMCAVFAFLTLLLGISVKINPTFVPNFPINHILLFCFVCLFILGLYAASTVLYRVFTFNNCESASLELKKQIEDAKSDLINKGIKF